MISRTRALSPDLPGGRERVSPPKLARASAKSETRPFPTVIFFRSNVLTSLSQVSLARPKAPRFLAPLVLGAAFLTAPSPARAAATLPYAVRSWTVQDGLPTSTVQDIAQTPDGYLWLSTTGGLARFDGVRFETFGLAQGLPSNRFQGMALHCERWHMEPLEVKHVASSWFDDRSRFPAGTATFDCALLMREIKHEWHSHSDLCCPSLAGIQRPTVNASM